MCSFSTIKLVVELIDLLIFVSVINKFLFLLAQISKVQPNEDLQIQSK